MSASWNLSNLIKARELLPIQKKVEIENALEDSFLLGQNNQRHDIRLPENVSSTIAIAIANDGLTFATTHGDHTVKIFKFYSNNPYRIFKGHPRTPWTVKYHPVNSNIVASGCLGYQVRVWDIEKNSCLNIYRLDFSIISLSFHPQGDHIAIASGSKLEIWNWVATMNSQPAIQGNTNNNSSNANNRQSPSQSSSQNRTVVHSRNIRAVCFHPSGDYLLAAAPDTPRPNGESLIYCSLYAIPFRNLFAEASHPAPFELQTFPVILPQIHLYSDGGFDVSKDGCYFVTCARLCQDVDALKFVSQQSVYSSFSPLSTTERVDEDERLLPAVPPAVPPLPPAMINFNTLPVFPPSSSIGDRRSSSFQQLNPPALLSPSSQPPPLQYRRISRERNELSNNNERSHEISNLNSSSNQNNNSLLHFPNSFSLSSIFSSSSSSAQQLRMSKGEEISRNTSEKTTNGVSLFSSSSKSPMNADSNHSRRLISSAAASNSRLRGPSAERKPLSVETEGLDKMDVTNDLKSNSQDSCNDELESNSGSFCNEFTSAKSSSSINSRRPISRNLKANICPTSIFYPGMKFDDYICVFKLEYDARLNLLVPKLLNAKLLKGKLMKAITSTKLSPTGRFILIGYGVRSSTGIVEDHAQPHAACEIISVQDAFLKTKAVMCDGDDEVNIAQFHPMPGHGIVYGTKRGKIRTFSRSIA